MPADLFLARPRTYAPTFTQTGRRSRGNPNRFPLGGSIYYPVWGGAVPWLPDGLTETHDTGSRTAILGRLQLRVQPAGAQIFIDGRFAGTARDFAGLGRAGAVAVGPHVVDIVAPGYEPARQDVTIVAGQAVTVRAALTPETDDAADADADAADLTDTALVLPPQAPLLAENVPSRGPRPAAEAPGAAAGTAAPVTPAVTLTGPTGPQLYVIPGCYAGTQPPDAATLPAGCTPAGRTTPFTGTLPPPAQ
ncbi:MAG: PEGA domain-containing protein [Acidobacteria bacterium]|nr:PEGA domain-containing protein [Acidobacteriota bacterium]